MNVLFIGSTVRVVDCKTCNLCCCVWLLSRVSEEGMNMDSSVLALVLFSSMFQDNAKAKFDEDDCCRVYLMRMIVAGFI